MRPFLVAVEGNIGAGKTTLLNQLKDWPMAECQEEPIDSWTNVANNNLLDLMYKQPKKYTFHFQVLAALKQPILQVSKPIQIVERSLISQLYCFGANALKRNDITPLEFELLSQLFNRCITWQTPDLIIYLKSSPEMALKRIQNRNRIEENNITLDYLSDIHQLHEKTFGNSDNDHTIVIDTDQFLNSFEIYNLKQKIVKHSYDHFKINFDYKLFN
jgi:deoxyadenosine/deoxycytidine kinase